MMFRIGSFELTEAEVARRKGYLEITPEDERRLLDAHPVIEAQADAIIERFYTHLLSHEHTSRLLSAPGLLERLKESQRRYFSELTAGRYDLPYFENRLRVGLVHERVGLSPEWYMGAYDRYLQLVSEVLQSALGSDLRRYLETTTALVKIVHLDMSLALEAYFLAAQDRLERRAAALEQANAEVVRLLAARQRLTDMIVHDLQNPLAGVVAYLQVLRADPSGLPAAHREALDEALRRCDDLRSLILAALGASRSESGRLEPRAEEVDLMDLVGHAAAGFLPAAEREGRAISVVGPPHLVLRTDPSLVLRILDNLVRNAVRHTPPGTSVILSAEPWASGGARVQVRDDGPGIPPALQPLLFDRSGSAALRRAGLMVDTGLGLAFCRLAAEALGARLTVESDGRRGTVFTMEFEQGD